MKCSNMLIIPLFAISFMIVYGFNNGHHKYIKGPILSSWIDQI